jgi:hypothetical protein
MLEDESNLHMDAVFDDLVIVDYDFLILDPRAFDVFQCLRGAIDTDLDGILEALA